MNQLITFTKLEHIDLFGLNVWRHTKEPSEKKRRSFLLGTYVFLAVIFTGYLGGSAYGMAMMGLADKIPMVWSFLISVLTVAFGMFKAGSLLYRERDLNLLASLPVKPFSIVAARLIRFYVGNLVIALLGMLPTFVISGIMGGFGANFYINMILAILIVPLLPTAIASWFGIATSAIVARNRHKVLTETILVLIVTVASLLLPMILTGGKITTTNMNLNADASSEVAMREFGVQISKAFEELENNAPFIKTWGAMFLGNNITGLIIYGLVSISALIVTALVIGRNFFGITAMLYSTSGHREFRLEQMQRSSVMKALVTKEAKRYFASGIYVSNTIVGPVMGVVFAISLAFFDMNKLLDGADLSGMPFELNLNASIPFVVAMTFSLTTIAASSISMEGKNRWILQSLPVAGEDIMKAKLLFNLIFVAPFYALAELIMLFTVHAGLMERIWIILIPAVFAVFAICFGLFCNIKFPNFTWETEVQVVKQSAAVGISMIGALVPMIAAAGLMIVPREFANLATLGVVVLISGITALLYRKVIKSAL